MKVKALLRAGDRFTVFEESDLEVETELQEAPKRNPEVILVGDPDRTGVIASPALRRSSLGAISEWDHPARVGRGEET